MSRKRSRSSAGSDSESSDDDFGPALPSTVPPKKKRKLPYESLYIAALPQCTKYSKSLMHKDQLALVTVAPDPLGFVITVSIDGVVKFWKKGLGVDFAKEFKAHECRIVAADCARGMYASLGEDGSVSIFDVQNLDLVQTLSVEGAGCLCWVSDRLAVAVGGSVRLYDVNQGNFDSVNVHRRDVVAMAYNPKFDCVVSADVSGMVEYWGPSGEKPDTVFELKSSTGLFEFKKAKSVPCSIVMSPTGSQWASMSFPDRKVRLFDFASGKLVRSYDESIATLTDLHVAGKEIHKLEEREFERRLGVEKELELVKNRLNMCFDESGHFISYGSLHGIKTVNTVTNRVVKLYGAEESFRAVNVGLYQGTGQKGVMTVSMAASANPLLEAAEEKDPMLVSTGFGKVRFYMFTNEEATKERDVHNERMQKGKKKDAAEQKVQLGNSATIHTNLGDIHVKLFAEQTPKTIENFTTHARNGYYNNTIFHRVIRKFMIQGGDPLGDGTGGTSIWGKEFEDEFVSELKHDRPYTVSMANAGPGTNGSQFFITTVEAAWLDGKHTVFGRVERGKDVVHLIENVRVNKEKPEEDVKIINISVH